MFKLMQKRREETGASAVEYGLLVAAIAALIVVIVFALGKLVNEGFTDTCTEIAKADHITENCGEEAAG